MKLVIYIHELIYMVQLLFISVTKDPL